MKLGMEIEPEPEISYHGEVLYCGDALKSFSKDFKTVDSTTQNEQDTNCIGAQPPVGIDPTDYDTNFLVKLSQVLQQSGVKESVHQWRSGRGGRGR